MKIKSALVILILQIISVYLQAYQAQEGQINLIVGPTVYQTPKTIHTPGYESPVRGGFGFILLGDINDKSSLDLTFLGLNKSYFREESGLTLAEETDLIHIALGYRRHLNTRFSTALLVYSAYSAGDVRQNYISQANTQLIQTSAHDKVEYGLDLSILTELIEFRDFSVVADARYSYALTARKNEDAHQMTFLLGLRYTLQSGKTIEEK